MQQEKEVDTKIKFCETGFEVICSGCRLKFQDVPSYKLHRLTEFHVYNTKRQIAELEPISEDVFEQKKACKVEFLVWR